MRNKAILHFRCSWKRRNKTTLDANGLGDVSYQIGIYLGDWTALSSEKP